MFPHTVRLALLLVLVAVGAVAGASLQTRAPSLREIQLAEDSRARDSVGMRPLRAALASGDTSLQMPALRAIARLESPGFLAEVYPYLSSPGRAVRSEAAFAVAQGSAGTAALPGEIRAAVIDTIFSVLGSAGARESDAYVRAALARSLSRVTPATQQHFRTVEQLVLAAIPASRDSNQVVWTMLALERLIRLHTRLGPVAPGTLDSLRRVFSGRSLHPAYARSLALSALIAAGAADLRFLELNAGDAEPRVRRGIAAAVAARPDFEQREALLRRFLRDTSQIVRVEAARGWLRAGSAGSCGPLADLITRDPAVNVQLAGIDALAQMDRCPAAERERLGLVLFEAAGELRRTRPPGSTDVNRTGMHLAAHALVTLARTEPDRARSMLGNAATYPSWIARVYAARAAALLSDTALLYSLSRDADANVVTEAITGLSRRVQRGADSVYLRVLENPDYNLVRTAATAMRGRPPSVTAVTLLQTALRRITNERRETSRDARMALLERIAELGTPASDSSLVLAYIADFDPVIAQRAAQLASRWTGRTVNSAPRPLPPADRPPGDAPVAPGTRLRFRMAAASGGGTFEMQLFPDVAPYTAARLLRLARAGYYNGLTFHRIVANFVVQGGSPGANEYVGDGPFMRDEIWLHSHERGTVGISTRGRDTGDAQIFINTVDNPRLDFDYTVFARVVSGMSTVDGILEGDRIATVEVVTGG